MKTPVWDHADEDTRGAFTELVEHLGEHVGPFELPEMFNDAVTWHRTIMEADLARSFEGEYARGKDHLSATLREMIERGQKVLAVDYNRAVDQIPVLNSMLDALFDWCDAILTPAATGEAPIGLESTGNPKLCTKWTRCGTPPICNPISQGPHGMPMGVQIVGPRGDDARLLRTARWLSSITST